MCLAVTNLVQPPGKGRGGEGGVGKKTQRCDQFLSNKEKLDFIEARGCLEDRGYSKYRR